MAILRFSIPPTLEEIDQAQQDIAYFETAEDPAIADSRTLLLGRVVYQLASQRDDYLKTHPIIAERLNSLHGLASAALQDLSKTN